MMGDSVRTSLMLGVPTSKGNEQSLSLAVKITAILSSTSQLFTFTPQRFGKFYLATVFKYFLSGLQDQS